MAPHFAASAPPRLTLLLNEEPYRAFVTVARALFPGAAAILAVRCQRPCSGCPGACLGADRGGRYHRSSRRDRAPRRDRRRHRDRWPARASVRTSASGANVRSAPAPRSSRADRRSRCASALARASARTGSASADPQGHGRVPQSRRVIIQDDVEIGAKVTDRPRFDPRYGHRRGDQDRQSRPNRAQRHDRAALPDRRASGIAGNVTVGRFCHDRRAGRRHRGCCNRRWRRASPGVV